MVKEEMLDNAAKMIMDAINGDGINSETEAKELLAKAFMSDKNKAKIQARIDKMEAKLKAMKEAAKL
jgi:hypothetical protein